MKFAYVSPVPAGLESEYKWVYAQDTSVKSTFSVLLLKDGTTKIYPGYVQPETVVAELRGWVWRRAYLMLSIASSAILVCRLIFRIRRGPRITR